MLATILDDIIRYKARKLAQKHIKRALLDIQGGGQFDFEECQQEINHNYWHRKSVNAVWGDAYGGPWYELGGKDAIKARRRFDVPAYLQGWEHQIMALAFDGWINPEIICKFGVVSDKIRPNIRGIKSALNDLDLDTE